MAVVARGWVSSVVASSHVISLSVAVSVTGGAHCVVSSASCLSLLGSKVSLHCQATPDTVGLRCEGESASESWERGGREGEDAQQERAAGEKSRACRGLGDKGGLCWREDAAEDGRDGACVAAGSLDTAVLGVAHSSSCLASSSSARALAWGVSASCASTAEQDGGLAAQAPLPRERLSALSFSIRRVAACKDCIVITLAGEDVMQIAASCSVCLQINGGQLVHHYIHQTLNGRAFLLPVYRFAPRAPHNGRRRLLLLPSARVTPTHHSNTVPHTCSRPRFMPVLTASSPRGRECRVGIHDGSGGVAPDPMVGMPSPAHTQFRWSHNTTSTPHHSLQLRPATCAGTMSPAALTALKGTRCPRAAAHAP